MNLRSTSANPFRVAVLANPTVQFGPRVWEFRKRHSRTRVSRAAIDAAIKVHTALGARLMVQAYKACLNQELQLHELQIHSEVSTPITCSAVTLEVGYRIDLLVEHAVIIEQRAVAQLLPTHNAQLLTYLKLSKVPLSPLRHFYSIHLKHGIIRMLIS